MIDLRFVPLEKPIYPKSGQYASKRFGCSWGTTLDDLELDLKNLEATSIVIEADLRRDQIRNDGWPHGGCLPATPGIRLGFTSKHGPLVYECGTFGTMEQNLRAIGLTLQRLRLIDEYGATKGGEQYKGFAQLPAGEFGTTEDAARFLIRMAGDLNAREQDVLSDPSLLKNIYRAAARTCHSDTGGGDKEMSKVNAAKALIESSNQLQPT